MPDNHDDLVSFARFRAPDRALIVEAELTDGHRYAVDLLARLEATAPPAAIELAFPPLDRIVELRRACFGDLWGHHEAGPPDIDSVFVALHERGAWVGICEVDPDAQWIDGPGVVPALRTPDRYARLVRGRRRSCKRSRSFSSRGEMRRPRSLRMSRSASGSCAPSRGGSLTYERAELAVRGGRGMLR